MLAMQHVKRKQKDKTVNVRIREELRDELKKEAIDRGITLQALLEEIIKPYKEKEI